jgi:hypothetical protein
VLLWSMDVLLRMPENGMNYAEFVRVDSINFGEKHPYFWSDLEKRHCIGRITR